MEVLTASRMTSLLTCPRKHYYRYELGLASMSEFDALTFGSAWHNAMEARWNNASYEVALQSAMGTESVSEIMGATLAGLLAGYYSYYSLENEIIKNIHPECEFRYGLKGSKSFDCAGKIDGLGTTFDGFQVLLEHKTCGEDISPGSDYWSRLRFNPQIYNYVDASRKGGWDLQKVIYDVTRKPSIRVKQNESIAEYAVRLADDTQARPEFYYQRREIAVLDQDLEQFIVQRLAIARMILYYRQSARKLAQPEWAWVRNCNGMTCRCCEYSSFCLQNLTVDIANPPVGFKLGEKNPELGIA